MVGSIRKLGQRITRERDELRRLVRIIRVGLRGLMTSQIPRMAAALAYRTIFSLIPVLVIGLAVLGGITDDAALENQLNRVLTYLKLDEINLDGGPGPAETADALPEGTAADDETAVAAAEGETGAAAQTEPIDQPADESADEQAGGGTGLPTARLDQLVREVVEQVRSVPFGAIGFVGLGVLMYAALSMMIELERSFNQIYRAPAGRAWWKRVPIYWFTLTVGTIFLLATFSVGDRVSDWSAHSAAWVRTTTSVAVNVVINFMLLLVAYKFVPNTRVHLRSAAVGAVLAGASWEIGKWGFTQYVEFSTGNLQRLYGALALLPLFMLWVYLTWVVVLFGLQVSYGLQAFRTWEADQEAERSGGRLMDPASALVVALVVARRFSAGETCGIRDVTAETALDDRGAALLLAELADAGVLRAAADADPDEPEYVLARPADTIAATDIMAVVRRLLLTARGGPGGERASSAAALAVLERLDRAERDALGGLTLADLIAERPGPAPKPENRTNTPAFARPAPTA